MTEQDAMDMISGRMMRCSKCGKPLIERLPNGLWRFKFGKPSFKDEHDAIIYDDKTGKPLLRNGATPVMMYIHGSIRMRCFRKKCMHWNTFDFLP